MLQQPDKREEGGGVRNNEGSHLVFDIKDDISLIFLLLSSRLTSLDIKRLTGYPSLRLVGSLHTCVKG